MCVMIIEHKVLTALPEVQICLLLKTSDSW